MTISRTARSTSSLVLCVAACGLPAGPALAEFTSLNVELLSQVPLGDFASNPSRGNDCWGYTSPSGREYALMGLRNAMAVVEITDPANPVIVEEIPHFDCVWGDFKTFGDRCYVVNDCTGGMNVVDLSDVDNGDVTLVQTFTGGGYSSSHNVAIDTDSGFLYVCGSNLAGGRLVAYSLTDPDNPAFAGEVSSAEGAYVHDAQIATYSSGPYAGRQIAFCANGGTGLDIYDVTDKSSMFRLSRTAYPNLGYAHQCWLSDDRQYLYLNDELDAINATVVFDVSDLSNPALVSTYSAQVAATDHNLYVHDGFVYEAEYRAGLRIFCAAEPGNPVQVGWFDTYPEDDNGGFEGAWSCYPFFPSGTVIVSDRERGLFVLDASAAWAAGGILFEYPDGQPDRIDPAGDTSARVEINGVCGGARRAGTGLLHVDDGSGFVSLPMMEVEPNVYDAVFPAVGCPAVISFYYSAESAQGDLVTDPVDAPATTYSALAVAAETVVTMDDFETDQGWVAENLGAATGDWQRGVPVDDPAWDYDPPQDADGSGQCYLTENLPGDTDVDGGMVRLTSPLLDLSGGDVMVVYEYFLRMTVANGFDGLRAQISGNGDAGPWIEIARHMTDGGLAWRHHEITPFDLDDAGVPVTATMKLRFTAGDGPPESIVEAGLDAFGLVRLECEEVLPGDLDGDGVVGILDLLTLLGAWGPCPDCLDCPADLDADCVVGILDLLALLANWG